MTFKKVMKTFFTELVWYTRLLGAVLVVACTTPGPVIARPVGRLCKLAAGHAMAETPHFSGARPVEGPSGLAPAVHGVLRSGLGPVVARRPGA